MEKQLLSVKEVAAYLGVSDDTVRRMISDNQIAFLKVRGQLKMSKANLERWIEMKTVPARKSA